MAMTLDGKESFHGGEKSICGYEGCDGRMPIAAGETAGEGSCLAFRLCFCGSPKLLIWPLCDSGCRAQWASGWSPRIQEAAFPDDIHLKENHPPPLPPHEWPKKKQMSLFEAKRLKHEFMLLTQHGIVLSMAFSKSKGVTETMFNQKALAMRETLEKLQSKSAKYFDSSPSSSTQEDHR